MVDKESPDFLFFCGSSLCFDVISLFNAMRPNSDSHLNGVGGGICMFRAWVSASSFVFTETRLRINSSSHYSHHVSIVNKFAN